MPNPFFSFKQFTVYHDLCAMKVGVDGVLLGAWSLVNDAQRILDVGTGSGLIALMLAQRSRAEIVAVDLDEGAIRQAGMNFSNSPWNDRLRLIHLSLQDFAGTNPEKFDLIVSNPPYFVDSLKSPDESRSLARHAGSLSINDLLEASVKILNETGRICLILPVDEGFQCVKLAENFQLFCLQKVLIFPKPGKPAKRVLLEFGFSDVETSVTSLTIENETRHCWSDDYISLTKDFYLKL
jgi:tRNA1Val (adenine37-N6)-methyltransferase